eukprot:gene4085-14185_t
MVQAATLTDKESDDQSQLAPGAATGSSLDPQLALSPTRVARRSDPPLHSPVAPAAPTRRMTRSMKFQLSPDLRPDLPDLHPDQEPNLSPVLSSAAEMDLDEPAFFTINDDIPIPKSYKAAMAASFTPHFASFSMPSNSKRIAMMRIVPREDSTLVRAHSRSAYATSVVRPSGLARVGNAVMRIFRRQSSKVSTDVKKAKKDGKMSPPPQRLEQVNMSETDLVISEVLAASSQGTPLAAAVDNADTAYAKQLQEQYRQKKQLKKLQAEAAKQAAKQAATGTVPTLSREDFDSNAYGQQLLEQSRHKKMLKKHLKFMEEAEVAKAADAARHAAEAKEAVLLAKDVPLGSWKPISSMKSTWTPKDPLVTAEGSAGEGANNCKRICWSRRKHLLVTAVRANAAPSHSPIPVPRLTPASLNNPLSHCPPRAPLLTACNGFKLTEVYGLAAWAIRGCGGWCEAE